MSYFTVIILNFKLNFLFHRGQLKHVVLIIVTNLRKNGSSKRGPVAIITNRHVPFPPILGEGICRSFVPQLFIFCTI